MNKRLVTLLIVMFLILFTLTGCTLISDIKDKDIKVVQNENNLEIKIDDTDSENVSALRSTKDINLRDLDGKKTNYTFTYKNEEFSAKYTKDNWHIKDSYKITNKNDLEIICQALIDVHPIHGKDMKSYRTADDLVYEWQQHNLAYSFLPDDNLWKSHAKDVDLDPADQGRSLEEMYEARTGSKLDITRLKSSDKVQKVKNSGKVQKVKNIIKEFIN